MNLSQIAALSVRPLAQGEVIAQCKYHYGSEVACRVVQLNHEPRDPQTWQAPIPVCATCREYLKGFWRYAKRKEKTNVS